MKMSIVIPAHNEEKRLERTLRTYLNYYDCLQEESCFNTEFVVVLNGCTDSTLSIVTAIQKDHDNVVIIDTPKAGKGLAIKLGFEDALTRDNDLIGFVDADMATSPNEFYELIDNIGDYDGIIASRYMKGSHVHPKRPFVKEWGRKLFFNSLIFMLFGMRFKDYQCGAKLFRYSVIKKVTPYLHIKQWAFDVELLYLCKKFGFKIKEIPTVWYDQEHSKLKVMRAGTRMLGALFEIRLRHSPFSFLYK